MRRQYAQITIDIGKPREAPRNIAVACTKQCL